MQSLDIRILEEPRPLPAEPWRDDTRRPAWRWRYRDPDTGEAVDPSELLTPAEVLALDPQAELIPGTRTVLPMPLIRLWR